MASDLHDRKASKYSSVHLATLASEKTTSAKAEAKVTKALPQLDGAHEQKRTSQRNAKKTQSKVKTSKAETTQGKGKAKHIQGQANSTKGKGKSKMNAMGKAKMAKKNAGFHLALPDEVDGFRFALPKWVHDESENDGEEDAGAEGPKDPRFAVKFLESTSEDPSTEKITQVRIIDLAQNLHSRTDYSNITAMDCAATAVHYLTLDEVYDYDHAFLDPDLDSFFLWKKTKPKMMDMYNYKLENEYVEFEEQQKNDIAKGKRPAKWPAYKQKLIPFPPFAVSRVDNIVRFGFLNNACDRWGEKCIKYIGNAALTEFTLEKVEEFGHEDPHIHPEVNVSQFVKYVLENKLCLENKGTIVQIETEWEDYDEHTVDVESEDDSDDDSANDVEDDAEHGVTASNAGAS